MRKFKFSLNDHHFILDTGVVITIPASEANMFEAADRVNEMIGKIDPAKYASKEYGWAARDIGFYLELWPSAVRN